MPSDIKHTIGILGCANIAKKNSRAAHKTSDCKVTTISSRSNDKAESFITEVLDSDPIKIHSGDDAYHELLHNNSGQLDSVYIPLPTKLHEQYVAKALALKYHVLLEKPVAISSNSYKNMLSEASKNNKFLMDGTMFVHHPRTKAFTTSINNPNRVSFNFTFDGTKNGQLSSNFFTNDIRLKKDGDFLGCVGDLGWYCVRMGLLVFSANDANALKGMVTDAQVVRYQLNDEGVPYEADCLVYFTDNRVLSFHCSFIHPLNQTVTISGTGAGYTATITDAILPLPGEKLSYTLFKQGLLKDAEITTQETKVVEFDNTDVQEVCMWKNYSKMARKIDEASTSDLPSSAVDEHKFWCGESDKVREANAIASYSLHTQIVLDALMTSIENDGAKVKVECA